jgi:UDP-glucose 4,6-dehydratase
LVEIKDYPNYKFVKGNICSSDLVSYVLKAEKIDTIMHFAAQTHVDNSFGNSFQFTQNNIMGTHVLLESAKVCGIRRFIHVSTDEVYGEQRLDQEAMSEEQVYSIISTLVESNLILFTFSRFLSPRTHMPPPKQALSF